MLLTIFLAFGLGIGPEPVPQVAGNPPVVAAEQAQTPASAPAGSNAPADAKEPPTLRAGEISRRHAGIGRDLARHVRVRADLRSAESLPSGHGPAPRTDHH